MESYIVEQYASQVLDFSSQYGSDTSFSYTAANCLGVPTKFPAYGDFPQTFVMKEFGLWWQKCPSGKYQQRKHLMACEANNEEEGRRDNNFIDLKFEHLVYVHAVYIYETFHPGAVTSIWGGDCKGRWQRIWYGSPVKVGHHPRVFSPPIKSTDFPINQIRIHFDQRHLAYYTEIDAVALLGTSAPSTVESRLMSGLVPLEQRGPILRRVIKMKLYQEASCDHVFDLEELAITMLVRSRKRERRITSDNGHFDKLPREVILHIFKYLNFYTLVQCCQVSRLLYQVASDPMLYVRLDLKPLFYCVSNETLKFLFGKTQYIHSLDLSWCGNYGRIAPHVLRTFLYSRGSSLSHLGLANCHVATNAVLNIVAHTCTNLVELNLSNCHILESGSFSDLSNLKNLRYLNLYRTQITFLELKPILLSNTRLQHLNISSCLNLRVDEVCLMLSTCNKNLLSLDLWRSTNLTSRGVFFLAKSLSNLEELDLGWCLGVHAQTGCIVALAKGCPKLVKLFLTAHRQTSDTELIAISENLTYMQQLSIMGTRNVTPGGVLSMSQALPSLQLLDVGYCEQLENQTFLSDLHSILPKCHIVTSFNQN